MWYVESGSSLTVSTGSVTTVSGLGYLQGQTVVPIVDGGVCPTQVVPSSGTITLPIAAYQQVVVGLPLTATATSMPPTLEGHKGPMDAMGKNLKRIQLRLLNSLGGTIFPGTSTAPVGNPIIQSMFTTYSTMGQSPNLVTGWLPALVQNNANDNDAVFTMQQTQPYPLNILGVSVEVSGSEE
jgi:hypothetical protein